MIALIPLDSGDWRPVLGYEGIYAVSSAGAVRRIGVQVRGAHVGHDLRWQRSSTGYPMVNLFRDRKRSQRSVHSIVAEAFIGPRPEGKEVNHIDANRWNPHISNLEYVTRAENGAHMRRIGNANYAVGEAAARAKLTEAQVYEIRAATGSLYAIADRYGVHHTTVRDIRHRYTWKHLKERRAS